MQREEEENRERVEEFMQEEDDDVDADQDKLDPSFLNRSVDENCKSSSRNLRKLPHVAARLCVGQALPIGWLYLLSWRR